MNEILTDKKYLVLTGNYGSGKTELALNLALQLSRVYRTTLVDLDIVNPYFRSGEKAEEMEKAGVRMLMPTFAMTTLDIPALVRLTLEKKAYAVILVHNHPSGDPHPGKADLELTRRAQLSLKLMGLVLLDHVIIADAAYFSLESETLYCTNAMISPFSNMSPCLPSTATMRPSTAETTSSMP